MTENDLLATEMLGDLCWQMIQDENISAKQMETMLEALLANDEDVVIVKSGGKAHGDSMVLFVGIEKGSVSDRRLASLVHAMKSSSWMKGRTMEIGIFYRDESSDIDVFPKST